MLFFMTPCKTQVTYFNNHMLALLQIAFIRVYARTNCYNGLSGGRKVEKVISEPPNFSYACCCQKWDVVQPSSQWASRIPIYHVLRTPGEEIAFTARPNIKSQSQIYSYGQSVFCPPYQPEFSGFFDLCLHWVSVVHVLTYIGEQLQKCKTFQGSFRRIWLHSKNGFMLTQEA